MNTATTINEHTVIRFACERDTAVIFDFIRSLAEYEKLLDQVEATVEGLRSELFIEKKAEVIICEYDGQAAGFALFFHNFSTFVGRRGLYIEDLFVKPEYRGRGLGKTLIEFCAAVAVERGCGRMEWSCLDWNGPSIAFYKKRGAVPMSEWTVYRLTGRELEDAAASIRSR